MRDQLHVAVETDPAPWNEEWLSPEGDLVVKDERGVVHHRLVVAAREAHPDHNHNETSELLGISHASVKRNLRQHRDHKCACDPPVAPDVTLREPSKIPDAELLLTYDALFDETVLPQLTANSTLKTVLAAAYDVAAARSLTPAEVALSSRERIRRARSALLYGLDIWIQRRGDALPPQAASLQGYPLGTSLRSVRQRHAAGLISPAYARELERRPGWTWDPSAHETHRHVEAITAHFAAHSTLRGLPQTERKWLNYARGERQWVGLEMARTAIQPIIEQVEQERMKAFFDALDAWVSSAPGRSASELRYRDVVTVDGQIYRLGARATYYRRRYRQAPRSRSAESEEKELPLSASEIARFEAVPGWDWGPDPYRQSRAASQNPAQARACVSG